ncbi:hypothetical protein BCF59_0254 [Mycoplasmopsis mustelae]|uniref:Uncharacterized protein n=1 Tax=Mycoplasmopsis mustelae TaxID=171289 RepID=A0A4R7UDZ6_9BACT|nr:hypothetical protein [Mycoplasmopsis mustelae]TDV24296.1 hypothetical protein BCF59_0254 [Mycoplasmopsis mustelae]
MKIKFNIANSKELTDFEKKKRNIIIAISENYNETNKKLAIKLGISIRSVFLL